MHLIHALISPSTRAAVFAAIVTATALFSVLAAEASAAVRYAAADGTAAAPCANKSDPCSLSTALTGVSSGDEIELAPGDYYRTVTVSVSPGVHLHGEAGKPRPTIRSSASSSAVGVNSGATLSYVEVTQSNVNPVVTSAGTVSRSRFIGTNPSSVYGSCSLDGKYLNSICVSLGGNAFYSWAIGSGAGSAVNLRNSVGVSFSADSADCGVWVRHETAYNRTYTLTNAAVDGVTTGVCLETTGTSAITMNLKNSAYRNVSSVGGSGTRVVNDTGPRISTFGFADYSGQDFHPATGSPLLDAGLTEVDNGTEDFDGNPRTIGAATDIGAFEVTPTTAPPAGGGAAPTPDVVAPTLKISKKPKSRTTSKKLKVSFSASEPARFECKLDKAKRFKTCKSPYKKTVETGKHKLQIRAIDPVGNVSSAKTVRWRVVKK